MWSRRCHWRCGCHWAVGFWRLKGRGNDERKENRGCEGDNSEQQECPGSNSGCFFPDAVNILVCRVGMFLQVGIHIDLAHVGGDIEEERKPSDPCEELNFTDSLDLRREGADGAEK